MAEGMGTKLNPDVNIWELARPLIEEWMRSHFGPRARLERALTETVEAARKLPRLVDTIEQIAERERRRAERELATSPQPAPSSEAMPGRRWRVDWAAVVAVAALAAAVVAWWR
jgi:ubiquinone biosynthesis protein